MLSGSSPSASLLRLLAICLVAVGVMGLLRRPASTSQPEPPGCDPELRDCADPPSADPAPPDPSTVVRAADVCRDAGYLCVEVERSGEWAVRRWKRFEGPLVVHVPAPAHEDRGVAVTLQRAAAAGIRAWNGQPFPILVDERGTREAHFAVAWSGSLGGAQIGRAETEWRSSSGLRVRRLVLASRSPFNAGRLLDPDQVRLTAAHEMGHALGLPHSDTPRDVMYPTNRGSSLTARDYRTLEALYALEDGVVIQR
jgi:hypothetical protein